MQAESDLTLARMKRRYNLAEMEAFFARAVRKCPTWCEDSYDGGVSGETDADFEQTCKTFIDGPFTYCHVFTYSERGTPAAKASEQVPMEKRGRPECSFTPAFGIQENGLPFGLSR